MAYKNGEIYGAVSINDVQRAVGSSSADLGQLIRNGNINKWARYKPVAYAGVSKIRSRDIRTYGLPFTPDPVFDAKTGLNIGIMTGSPSDVAAWTDAEIAYERPSGGTAQPYRLTDWSGYNHYAQEPARFIWNGTLVQINGQCYAKKEDGSRGSNVGNFSGYRRGEVMKYTTSETTPEYGTMIWEAIQDIVSHIDADSNE